MNSWNATCCMHVRRVCVSACTQKGRKRGRFPLYGHRALAASVIFCLLQFYSPSFGWFYSPSFGWFLYFHLWVSVSCSVVPGSLWPHGLLQPTRLLRPWDFPGKDAGVGCHFLLWGKLPPKFASWIAKKTKICSFRLQALFPSYILFSFLSLICICKSLKLII